MANYVKATNFTAKDSLPSGNPSKIVKGAEIDTEFTAIASAISSKADLNSPALTGTPTAPTAALNTNTTQIATTAFVRAEAADAVVDERTATATLTNKTLTSPTINTATIDTATITGGTISGMTSIAGGTISGTTGTFSSTVQATLFTQTTNFTNSANGYIKLPSGAILQWGTVTISDVQTNFAQYWWEKGTSVTFPITFPNNCWNVQVTGRGIENSSGEGGSADSITTSGFFALGWNGGGNAQGQNVTLNWVAIGN